MATDIKWLDDASQPITAENFGTVDVNTSTTIKFFITNEGSSTATGVVLKRRAVASNDGVSYVSLALDNGSGNPGTFSTGDVFIGNVQPGQLIPVWIKVTLPGGITPAGNVRMFDYVTEYTGT